MKIEVTWEEKGLIFIDVLEVGKTCTQEQANALLEKGIAKIIMEDA